MGCYAQSTVTACPEVCALPVHSLVGGLAMGYASTIFVASRVASFVDPVSDKARDKSVLKSA